MGSVWWRRWRRWREGDKTGTVGWATIHIYVIHKLPMGYCECQCVNSPVQREAILAESTAGLGHGARGKERFTR